MQELFAFQRNCSNYCCIKLMNGVLLVSVAEKTGKFVIAEEHIV